MRQMKTVLKVAAVAVVALAVLLGVAAVALNSSAVQNRMMGYATELLRQKLGTQVRIDSVHVDFLTQKALLAGLEVDDQQQRQMLALERLSANFSLWDLLQRTVTISDVSMKGVRARLYKPEGEPANYQFVVDAFRKDKAEADTTARDTTEQHALQLNVKNVRLEDIDVQYNEEHHASLRLLTADRRRRKWDVDIADLRYQRDDGQPRRNAGKPGRGSFDARHMDLTTSLRLTVDHTGRDTLHAEMKQCVVVDSVAGVNLKDLRFKVGAGRQTVSLADVVIQQENTTLQFEAGEMRLPDKEKGRALAYSTSDIKGRVVLKDISHPFAPVLRQFTMPLNLRVRLSGTADAMTFSNISVATADQRLNIAASGGIAHLSDKERMDIRFHIGSIKAKGNVKRDVINQFAVRKFMMKQLDALGSIAYTGDIVIRHRRETFSGLLRTAAGALNFSVTLDGRTQYVSGSLRTADLQLGKVLDMPDIGKVAGDATFRFDYSVPRTKKIRRLHGGKLPIGSVKANIDEAHYKKVSVKHIEATVESNGAQAQGNIEQRSKHVDLLCSFSFDDTDALRKMKIKPGIKIKALQNIGKQIEEKKTKAKQKKAERKARKQAAG